MSGRRSQAKRMKLLAPWLSHGSKFKARFRQWAPYALLFILWIIYLIVHFHFGPKVIGVFFSGLALMLVLLRREWKPLLVAMFAAVVLLTTGVVDTWAALHDSAINLAMNITDLVPVLNMPGSGLEVVPQEPRQAAELLAEAGASSYRLSPALIKDALVQQRIVEVIWPLRLEPTSP